MPDDPQHEFRTIALDPDRLSTPFAIQTNWHVLTGAPCSGKTTLIDQLADKGFRTVPETGRIYFKKELAKGRSIGEIRANGIATERRMLELQLRYEHKLPVQEVAFLDRGWPDCLTYSRVASLDPNAILAGCFQHRYAAVFVLDRFPLQPDSMRFEDEATAGLIDEWLARDYGALGYDVVRVPVLPREERLAYVLERLSEQGLT